jgi:hypothetical protein
MLLYKRDLPPRLGLIFISTDTKKLKMFEMRMIRRIRGKKMEKKQED